VAKRIEELQVRNERKSETAALTRDELIKILAEIVHAARNRLQEVRTADGLKAAEMLARMCGYNEPEQVKHDHVHLQVDAALIEQLRAGYAADSLQGAPLALQEGASGGTHSEREATSAKRKPARGRLNISSVIEAIYRDLSRTYC
jgi:hypothetical protein